jgi:hypothetical protein
MALTQTGPLTIVFLDRSRLQVANSQTGNLATWDVSPQIMRDLVILNTAEFGKQLGAFITQQKMSPGPTVVVLSYTTVFTKSIEADSDEARLEAMQQFFDSIPFDSLLTKSYPTGKNTIAAVAVSRELVETLMGELSKRGFGATAVVPQTVLPKEAQLPALSSAFIATVIKVASSLNTLSLISPAGNTHSLGENNQKKPNRQQILVGVFGVLLFILLLVLLTRI